MLRILGTVFDAIFSVIMLIGLTAILEVAEGATGTATFTVVAIITIALGVIALVFNAICISGFSCKPETYRKKRGLIITAVVFNFLLALILLITVFNSPQVINILVLLSSIAAGVLLIVDLALENKRVAKLQAAEQPQEEKTEA